MKVFVTGASGQLGYDVCRVLTERNIEYKGVLHHCFYYEIDKEGV